MPNHVAHRVNVMGSPERVAEFKALMIVEKEEFYGPFHADPALRNKPTGETYLSFDFERVIPMPAILHETESGSNVSFGLFALGEREQGLYAGLSSPLDYKWVQELGITTREEFRAWLEKERPEALVKAQTALQAQRETGYQSWYDWALENWGTKWNAYNFHLSADDPNMLEFTFNTAWSHPAPVFEKLGELFPDLTIEVLCFDEGWGFAGEGAYGDTRGLDCFALVKPTNELYEEVYGHAPEHYEEEV